MLKSVLLLTVVCVLMYTSYKLVSGSKTKTFSDQLKDIVKEVNTEKHGWTAEYNNRFDDHTEESVKQFLGLKEKSDSQIQELKQRNIRNMSKWNDLAVDIQHLLIPDSDLPETFDAREKWPQCKTLFDIRDQSRCGSCWAVSSALVMSARLCIGSGQKDQRYVSADDVLSCCKNCGQDALGGCDGGYEDNAFREWVDRGFVTGGNYDPFPDTVTTSCKPYPFPMCAHHLPGQLGLPSCHPERPWFKTPECKTECKKGYNKSYWDDITRGRVWYTVSGEADMMRDLYTNGPLSIAIDLKSDLFTYKSGVYKAGKGIDCGGHAVNLFGWGVENGVKYWLVQNEWNSGWGDQGYVRVLRGVNEIGIESDATAGLAAFEKPQPKQQTPPKQAKAADAAKEDPLGPPGFALTS